MTDNSDILTIGSDSLNNVEDWEKWWNQNFEERLGPLSSQQLMSKQNLIEALENKIIIAIQKYSFDMFDAVMDVFRAISVKPDVVNIIQKEKNSSAFFVNLLEDYLQENNPSTVNNIFYNLDQIEN